MTENAKNGNTGTFWLELILTVFIPFMIWWSMTPTNVLNSSSLFGLLEHIGIGGSVLIFFVGIPVGIIGIRKAKDAGVQTKQFIFKVPQKRGVPRRSLERLGLL